MNRNALDATDEPRCYAISGLNLEIAYSNAPAHTDNYCSICSVGQVAWLLGIEEEKQIASHPLRGNLFENMVVMDVLKYRYNHGNRANLSFYRDSNGNEVDLLYMLGNDLLPIEIKSGQTITSAYFDGLKKFAALFPDRLPWPGLLVYGGETEQVRQTAKVVQVYSLSRHLDVLHA
jgi:hypothetical protein